MPDEKPIERRAYGLNPRAIVPPVDHRMEQPGEIRGPNPIPIVPPPVPQPGPTPQPIVPPAPPPTKE